MSYLKASKGLWSNFQTKVFLDSHWTMKLTVRSCNTQITTVRSPQATSSNHQTATYLTQHPHTPKKHIFTIFLDLYSHHKHNISINTNKKSPMSCSSPRIFNNLIIAQKVLIFPSKTLPISSFSSFSHPKISCFSTRFSGTNKTPVLGSTSIRSMATQSKQSVYDFTVKVCCFFWDFEIILLVKDSFFLLWVLKFRSFLMLLFVICLVLVVIILGVWIVFSGYRFRWNYGFLLLSVFICKNLILIF